jgi:hypothetical protein
MYEQKNGYQRAVERGQYAESLVKAKSGMNALQRWVSEGNMKGPHTHINDGVPQDGYWHKENHQGPQDCVGCCIDG